MKVSKSELFEMNLYYREVIGRDGAPNEVKQIDIIKLLDHTAALENEMALMMKGSGVGIEIDTSAIKSKSSPVQGAKRSRQKKAAEDIPPGQIDIFEIGGDK